MVFYQSGSNVVASQPRELRLNPQIHSLLPQKNISLNSYLKMSATPWLPEGSETKAGEPMKSKVAKLKAVDAWRPTRDDPAIRALAKELTAMFMANMPPDVSAEERRQRFAEFGKESQAEFRAADAADTAACCDAHIF